MASSLVLGRWIRVTAMALVLALVLPEFGSLALGAAGSPEAATASPAVPNGAAPTPPEVPMPLSPGTVTSSVAPLVSSVADGAYEPRLFVTNTSYIYQTPSGKFSFAKDTPQVMSYALPNGTQLVSASTFFVTPMVTSIIYNPRVVAANNHTFVAEYGVALDTSGLALGTVRITTSFSAYGSPKVSSSFTQPATSALTNFHLQWALVPSVFYLQLNGTQAVDIRSLATPQVINVSKFTDQIGDSTTPGSWRTYLRVDWSDAGAGNLSAGTVNLPGVGSAYGLQVVFPSNMASVDPTLVGGVSQNGATAYPSQRKTFFNDGFYWAFYYDANTTNPGVRVRNSPDGVDWNMASDPYTGTVYYGFDLAQSGSTVLMAWVDGSGTTLWFVKGTLSKSYVTWGSTRVVDSWSNPSGSFHAPGPVGVGLTSDNFAWITAAWYDTTGAVYIRSIYRSLDNTASFFSLVRRDPTQGLGLEMVKPVGPPNGNTILLITDPGSTTLWWYLFSAGSLYGLYSKTINLPNGRGAASDAYTWISAVTTSDGTIWTVYANANGGIDYTSITPPYDNSGGTTGSIVASSTRTSQYPSMGVDPNDNLYAFWTTFNNVTLTYYINYSVRTALGWSSVLNLFTTSNLNAATYLSASARVADQAFMVWTQQELSGSYDVQFLSLPLPSSLGAAAGQPWSRDGISPFGQYFKQLSDYIAPGDGLLTVIHTDVNLPGRGGLDLSISRVFSTPRTFLKDSSGNPYPYLYDRYLGANLSYGWQLNFPWVGQYYLHLWNGQTYLITWDANKVFENHAGEHFRLEQVTCGDGTPGCYRLTVKSGVRYDFGSTGRLMKITDASGKNRIVFAFNANNDIASITDSLGRVVTFGYTGSAPYLLTSLSWSGRTVQYQYTPLGNQLSKLIDPLGRATSFYYNQTNKYLLSEIAYPTGGKTTYVYGPANVGSEATSYLVTRQNVYNGSALVKSTSYAYQVINGRVSYCKVTNSDGYSVQGYTVHGFNGPGGSTSVTTYDTATNRPINDDFENSTAYGFTSQAGTWSIVSAGSPRGRVYQGSASAGTTAYTTALGSSYRDYTVQARVRRVAGSDVSLAGRFQDANNWYRLRISGGTLYLEKMVASSTTILKSQTVYAGLNGWHILGLQFEGATITAFYDGVQVWQVMDTGVSSGGVALEAYDASVTSTAQFDDVLVFLPKAQQRTVTWFDATGQSTQTDMHQGDVDTKTYSTLSSYDNWGNLIYSRDALGHEKFGSYGNTQTSNTFYAPGRLAPSASGKILLADFSNWSLGGWSLDLSGGPVALTALADPASAPSLSVTSTSTSSATSATRYFPGQAGSFVVEARLMAGQTNKDVLFNLNSGGTVRGYLKMKSDQSMYAGNAGTDVSLGMFYRQNLWYRVVFVVTMSTAKYDVWIDGTVKANGMNLAAATGNPDNLQLKASSPGASGTTTAYGDDFRVYAGTTVSLGGLYPGMEVEAVDASGQTPWTNTIPSGSTSASLALNSLKARDFNLRVYNDTQPIRNGNMESSSGWTFASINTNFVDYGYNTNYYHSGLQSHEIGMPSSNQYNAGDWASIYQDVSGLGTADTLRAWFKMDNLVCSSTTAFISARLSLSDYGANANLRDIAWVSVNGQGPMDWTQISGVPGKSSFRLHLRIVSDTGTKTGGACGANLYTDDADGPAEYATPSKELWGGDAYSYLRPRWKGGDFYNTSSPILYYDMQSTTTLGNKLQMQDLSRNNNRGTLTGTTSADGYIGMAHHFNGTGDYIEAPDSSSLEVNGDITVAMWVYLDVNPDCDANNNWRVLLTKRSYAANDFGAYFVLLEENRLPSWSVSSGGAFQRFFPTTGAIPIGSWTHIAFTRLASTGVMSYYMNGNLIQSSTGLAAGPIDRLTGNFRIGGGSNTASCPFGNGGFPGSIDEVYVHDRALSASDISTLAAQRGPVLNYDMETLTGSGQMQDLSGKDNHGTITGTVSVNGLLGNARDYSASLNNRIGAVDSNSLDVTSGITMAAWVKARSFPSSPCCGNSRILAKRDGGTLGAYELYIYGATKKFNAFLQASDATTATLDSNYLLPFGEWHHVAFTWQSSDGTWRFYVDGVQTNTGFALQGKTLIHTVDSVWVGSIGSYSDPWDGVIDEVYLFDRALSSSEVWDNYIRRMPIDAHDRLLGSMEWQNGSLDPVAYYDMQTLARSDLMKDVSGNQNQGRMSGTTDAAGFAGRARSFNGAGDYIAAGNSASLNVNQITISAWVWLNSFSTSANSARVIASKWACVNPDYGYHFDVYTPDGTTQNLRLAVANSSTPWRELDWAMPASGYTGRWLQLAATYSGTSIALYADGLLKSQYNYSSPMYIGPTSVPLAIGSHSGCGLGLWSWYGTIDELRIYNRVLSSTEVRDAAAKVAWLDMETFTSTNTLRDMSGYQNSATVTGATLVPGKVGKALQFDGVGNYVTAPDKAGGTATSSFTMSAWVNLQNAPSSPLQNRYIFSKFDRAAIRAYCFDQTAGVHVAKFGMIWGTTSQASGVFSDFNPTDTNGNPIDLRGAWHHVAMTYDAPSHILHLYLDGVEKTPAGGVASGGDLRAGGDYYIGSWYSTYGFLPGGVDEAVLYNRALSASEVGALFRPGPRTTLPMRSFFRHDLQGQSSESRTYHNASWVYTQRTYDPYGNVLTSTDPASQVSQYAYSSTYNSAYLTQVTRPDTSTMSFTYDSNAGLALSGTNPNGYTSRYTYDLLGRPLTSSFPAVSGSYSSTANRYDDVGNSVSIYDENSKNRTLNLDLETTIGVKGKAKPLYYDMERVYDGKMDDLSGNGNYGTITGTTSTDGQWGLARHFNAGSDLIQAAGPATTTAYPRFTISMDVRETVATQPNTWGGLFTYGTSPNAQILFYHNNGNSKWFWKVKWNDATINDGWWGVDLTDGKWHHVSLVYDSNNLIPYLDGVAGTKAAAASKTVTPGVTPKFGAGDSPGVGDVDEAYIFDRDLPASEVSRLYGQNTVGMLEDLSGNGAHAVMYGTTSVAGKIGKARQFNGTTDYIDAGNVAGFYGTQAFTVAFWMNSPAFNTIWARIFSKETTDGNGRQGWLIDRNANTNTVGLERWQNGAATSLYVTFSTNVWQHVVFTYDGTNMRAYIGGALVGGPTASSQSLVSANTNPLRMGAHSAGGSAWNGALDEVHIYNRVLSATEVSALYNANEQGHYEKRYFDGIGRLIRSVRRDFFGGLYSSTNQTYNWQDQVVNATDPMGNAYLTSYDFLGRPLRTANPDGSFRRTVYDDVNSILYAYDETARLTSYQSDWNGHLVKVGEWNPGASNYNYSRYGYLEDGQLSTVTDATNKVTRHTYDDVGHLIRTDFPDGNHTFEAYVYDVRGNLIQKTLRNNTVINYAYDSMNRLVNSTYPGGGWISRSYDKDGNLQKVRGPVQGTNPWVLWFQYDPRDRMTYEYQNIGGTNRSVQYGYDAASNVNSMAYGGTTFTYTYDSFNRNAAVCQGSPTCTNLATFTFRRDDAITGIAYGNGVKTSYTFDPKRSWPVHLWVNSTGNKGTTLLNMVYTYSTAGEVTKVQVDKSGVHSNETYTYDGQDRLLKYVYTGSSTYSQAFTYDAVGNRLTQTEVAGSTYTTTYTYREDNRLATYVNGSVVTNYQYDWNGNQIQRVQAGITRTLSFDYDNHLTKVVDGSTTVAAYGYDGLGRRVKGVEGTTAYFLSSGQQMVYTVTGATAGVYLYANGLLVANTSANQYFHQDRLGSVRLVTTSTAGTAFASDYRPFGGQSNRAGSDQRIKFTGEWQSSSTGLYYLGVRWYDPAVGRFISQDPVLGRRPVPQTLNRNVYVGNNPVMRTDPTGKFWNIVIGAVAGAIVGGTIYAITTSATGQQWDWGQFGTSVAIGALSGAIAGATFNPGAGIAAASSLSTAQRVGVGAAVGAGTGALAYTATSLSSGTFSWQGLAGAAVSGGIAGGISALIPGGSATGFFGSGLVSRIGQSGATFVAVAGAGFFNAGLGMLSNAAGGGVEYALSGGKSGGITPAGITRSGIAGMASGYAGEGMSKWIAPKIPGFAEYPATTSVALRSGLIAGVLQAPVDLGLGTLLQPIIPGYADPGG